MPGILGVYAGGGLLLLIGIIVFLVYRQGRIAAQLEAEKQAVDRAREGLTIDEQVAGLSDDDVRKRLFFGK